MEGVSSIIPVYNKIDVTVDCIKNVMKMNPGIEMEMSFDHRAATSRSIIAEDITIRRKAQDTFLKIWVDRLPADLTTWQERMRAIFSSGKRS